MTDDHLIAALHRACGAPMRGLVAGAVALSTSALVLHEAALSLAALDRLCARFAAPTPTHARAAQTPSSSRASSASTRSPAGA